MLEGGPAKVPGTNGSRNGESGCIRGWDSQGGCFGKRWRCGDGGGDREGCMWGDAVPGTVGLRTERLKQTGQIVPRQRFQEGKRVPMGRPVCLLMLMVPEAPPDPVPAPLWCFMGWGERVLTVQAGLADGLVDPAGLHHPLSQVAGFAALPARRVHLGEALVLGAPGGSLGEKTEPGGDPCYGTFPAGGDVPHIWVGSRSGVDIPCQG